MVTLRKGRVIAVGSFAAVGMEKAVMMNSTVIMRMMKRSMARRFLGVVQLNMRRFRDWVVICSSLATSVVLFVVGVGININFAVCVCGVKF